MQWLRRTSTLLRGLLKPKKLQASSFKVSWRNGHSESSLKGHLDVPESPLEFVDLKNGMRLICECKDSCVTTVGFLVPAGSMHERPDERGASLFMEHLLFRRTRCRTREEIAEILDRTGAKLSALAMRDMFLFYGTIPSHDVAVIVELMVDVILNGITCDEDVVAERCILLRELCEMETDYERVVMDYLPTLAYQGTELGKSVYPETCVIENMTVDTIESFRTRLFQPSLMTMISTGGTSFTDIQNLASEYFVGTSQDNCPIEGQCTPKDYLCSPCFRYTGSDLRFRDDDVSLGHVAVAVEGPGHLDCEDHCTLTVAKEIVGFWDLTFGGGKNNSPRLAECAFGTDMCHMYKSFNIGWANTGLWGCFFSCGKMQLEDMMWMVQNEWMRLCMEITSREVARAVNQCRMRELVRVNDSVDRFYDIAICLYRRGCYEPFNHRIARYESVTADKLREVANKYIYDQCPVVVAVGPVENLLDYNHIRSSMYRIRY
ncbi:cytochrome b-c1 complex subunit 1, mitochondrial-like [Venturia canescens]|uniref:cytochrome b-c1 complex subunit 1, mitochondrial-like n=1 Tax=Venturia canescens TaxID=32260 RepID=UPI001C9CB7DA|nr:cytochrome b-c1 complex subunit 1, mitochondrial-like [Venturia canescens]